MTTETGPIGKRLNPDEAAPYIKMARNLLGEMHTQQRLGGVNYLKRSLELPDGTQIKAWVDGALDRVEIILPEEEGVVTVCLPWIQGFVGLGRSDAPNGDTRFYDIVAINTQGEEFYTPYYYTLNDAPEGASVAPYSTYFAEDGALYPWYRSPLEYAEVDWFNPDDETIPVVSFPGNGGRGLMKTVNTNSPRGLSTQIYTLGFRVAETPETCWGAGIRRTQNNEYYLYAVIEDPIGNKGPRPYAWQVVRARLNFLPLGCFQYNEYTTDYETLYPIEDWETVSKTGILDDRGTDLMYSGTPAPDVGGQPWFLSQDATKAVAWFGDIWGGSYVMEMRLDSGVVKRLTSYFQHPLWRQGGANGPESSVNGFSSSDVRGQTPTGDFVTACGQGSTHCCVGYAPSVGFLTTYDQDGDVLSAFPEIIPGSGARVSFDKLRGVVGVDYKDNQVVYFFYHRQDFVGPYEHAQFTNARTHGLRGAPEFGPECEVEPWEWDPHEAPIVDFGNRPPPGQHEWNAAGGADGLFTDGGFSGGGLEKGPFAFYAQLYLDVSVSQGKPSEGSQNLIAVSQNLTVSRSVIRYFDLRHDLLVYYDIYGSTTDPDAAHYEVPISYIDLVVVKRQQVIKRKRMESSLLYDYVPFRDFFEPDFLYQWGSSRPVAVDRYGNIFISVDPREDFFVGDTFNYLSSTDQDEESLAATLFQIFDSNVHFNPVGLI